MSVIVLGAKCCGAEEVVKILNDRERIKNPELARYLSPAEMRQVKASGNNSDLTVFIDVLPEDRYRKVEEFFGNQTEALSKMVMEIGQFDGVDYEVDLVIHNYNNVYSNHEIADMVYSKYYR